MTLVLDPRAAPCAPSAMVGSGWRARRRERRRLTERDRSAAQLAELHHIRALLAETRELVEERWLQDVWFAYLDARGRERVVTAHHVHLVGARPVTGACLVGAVLLAGGGPIAGAIGGEQPVQRALDLIWHTLHGAAPEPVRWCPAPAVRMQHVRDLTRWNDRSGRRVQQVVELLQRADAVAVAEIRRLQIEQNWASRGRPTIGAALDA